MGTISAKKITDALAKAKDVGVVEEELTIDDVSIVLRNLRPDQYAALYQENNEREGIDSLYAFQLGHLCRSIVEINGVDLRDVEFVEVDEPVLDPKTGDPVIDPQTHEPKVKKVRLERHEYVATYVLKRWLKEALQVAWRKFGEVLKSAEDKAKEGVHFLLPEMTPEERFREAIGNVREVIEEVPKAIVESVLEEAGLMRMSTAAEIQRALEKTDKLASELGATSGSPIEGTTSAAPPPEQQATPPQQQPVMDPRVRPATPQEIMARRTPLNRDAVQVPSPVVQPVMASPHTLVQTPQQAPPQGPPQVPPQISGGEALNAAQRNQRIARLEAESLDLGTAVPPPGDPTMAQRHVPPGSAQPNAPHLQTGTPPEAPVLQKGRDKVDMKTFSQNVNRPPAGGINPRFRPTPR
jgi:hypothetical protein